MLLRIADVCKIDISDMFERKIRLSAKKYPVEKVKGKPHKYTHYSRQPAKF